MIRVFACAALALLIVAIFAVTIQMRAPELGTTRDVTGISNPVRYPGEQITVRTKTVQGATRQADGQKALMLEADGVIVEPVPGFHGWWLRAKFALWGAWVEREP